MQAVKEILNEKRNTENTEKKIDVNSLKRRFLEIAEKETAGRFMIDNRNREIVSSLFSYFLDIPGSLDLNKGIWLEGNIGTGKTTLMQVFSAFMRSLQRGFKVFSSTSVATCYAIDGNLDFFLHNRDGYLQEAVPICFDELGREPIPASHYGTKLNVMQHILQVRYELWKTSGLKTYVTTNSDAAETASLYGDFIRDRRKELFNILAVGGESRR